MRARAAAALFAVLKRRVADRRPADTLVHDAGGEVALHRWWLLPRNPVFNVYLHHFVRSNDPRALHDHPWVNCSLVLSKGYFECIPTLGWDGRPNYQVTRQVWRAPGAVVFRWPKQAHRIVLPWTYTNCLTALALQPAWSLLITGPRVRVWGFYCAQGWRDFKAFTGRKGSYTTGCE